MTIASIARWAALVGLALQAAGATAHAEPILAQIGIQVADNNAAVKRCADELIKRSKSSPLVPKGLRVAPLETILDERDKLRDSGRSIPAFIYVSDKSHEYDLIKVPFVFRDAEHVLAFLHSGEFYRKIRDNPTEYWSSQQRLAIAYGGFYQMFSKAAAVTEPKHFYGRFIGGTVREPELYRQFGAYMNPFTAVTGMFAGLDARGADDMSRDDRMTQIVEAHLASAIENGFKGKGRFVNLVSSSMLAVDILVWKGSDEISPENMAALRSWAEEAAAACSEANYQKELEVLEALKADGYQIVPFNRRALVERSWSTSLEKRHAYWTIEQFDMLARLGKFPNGDLLPSALLAKMTAQKRKEA